MDWNIRDRFNMLRPSHLIGVNSDGFSVGLAYPFAAGILLWVIRKRSGKEDRWRKRQAYCRLHIAAPLKEVIGCRLW